MTLARFVTADGMEFWADDMADLNGGSLRARVYFAERPKPFAHYVAGSLRNCYAAKVVLFDIAKYAIPVRSPVEGVLCVEFYYEYRERGSDRDGHWSAMSIEARRNARSIETAVATPKPT